MRPKLIALFALSLLVPSAVARAADGGFALTGNVGLGYQSVNANTLDPSKLTEFRHLTDGVLGTFDVRGRGDEYYLNVFGENLGRDDQYVDLKGGRYGVFKYQIYDNDVRHNFATGFGALTPYFGAGTSTLTAATNATGIINKNPNTWNAFDASYKRQDIGAMFEVSARSPFYFRIDANQVKRDGIKDMAAAAQGASPGNGFVDLPSPVDFTTNSVSLEAGYQSKRGHVALNAMRSKFSNSNPYLNWTNGFWGGGMDTTVLPRDNDFTKFSLNGNLRQLPGGSVLAGRLTYSKTTSSFDVLQNMLATAAGVFQPTNPSSAGFAGEVVYKTASLSLNSQPGRGVDTKLYWNWTRKDNNSTPMTFTPAAGSNLLCGGGPCVTELFNYKKNNFGIEGGYRFNPQNRVIAGFDYLHADRERVDFDRNIDRKYSLEWKNSSFDTLDTRVKYQYLERRSNFIETRAFEGFTQRFDLSNVNQNLGKVVMDFSPRPMLDFGLEVIYKHNDFTGDRLWVGRTKDVRQELYASVGFGDPKAFRVLLFADTEFIQYDSLHRVGAVPANGDPNSPPAGGPPSTSYTWSATNKDRAYQVGLGVDWLPHERWIVKSSLIWMKTDGTADFAAQAGTVLAAPGLVNIHNFDNSTRTSFNLRGTYKYSRNWDFSGGYAFERYRLSDIAIDGYKYTVGAGTTTSYASGLNAFPNYTTNIVYLLAGYKFQ